MRQFIAVIFPQRCRKIGQILNKIKGVRIGVCWISAVEAPFGALQLPGIQYQGLLLLYSLYMDDRTACHFQHLMESRFLGFGKKLGYIARLAKMTPEYIIPQCQIGAADWAVIL
ncbi:MAG: hypothetical protein ACYDCX_11885 [Acidithiobacillus sp.]